MSSVCTFFTIRLNCLGQAALLFDCVNYRCRGFIVTNCHVCEGPKLYTEKIGQVILMLAMVDKLKQMCPPDSYVGTFFCGSFAFEPMSPLYKFVTSGHLDFERHDMRVADYTVRVPSRSSREKSSQNTQFPIPPEVKIFNKTCSFLDSSVKGKLTFSGCFYINLIIF